MGESKLTLERKKELQNLIVGAMREIKELDNEKHKKIYLVSGVMLIILALLFFYIFTNIIVQAETESVKRDLLGLVIPEPPLFVSYIPFVGFLVGILFEMFSLHGLVSMVVALSLAGVGISLLSKGTPR